MMRWFAAFVFLACAAPVAAQSAAPDPVAPAKPALDRATAAARAGRWAAAADDLRAAREMLRKAAGEKDPRALHAGALLVEALTRANALEDAIQEGASLLPLFPQTALMAPDALSVRYFLADAFARCIAARCGGTAHRLKNVDALMETLLSALAAYPKGDARVTQLRADFAAACAQRYEAADCAAAQGK